MPNVPGNEMDRPEIKFKQQNETDDVPISLSLKITGIAFWGVALIGIIIAYFAITQMEYNLNEHSRAINYKTILLARELIEKHPDQSKADLIKNLDNILNETDAAGITLSSKLYGLISAGQINDDLDRYSRTFTFSPIQNIDPVTFTIYQQSNQNIISQQKKQLMIWIGGLIFIFGMLLQAILKRMLSDPMQQMVHTAQSVIKGEETSFDTSRRDEFGFLARFINKALESLKHRQQELSYQASHDTLTGIYNRSEFDRHLQLTLETANTEDVHFTLCYLDLDQFKIINDTCGHIAGDELLRQITQTLKSELRESDFLSRLGGDEFGIILSGCDEHAAVHIADKLREAVSKFHFKWEGKAFQIGVSIGVVPISDASISFHDLLSSADVACYAAKEQGRNQIHVYEPDDKILQRKRGEMKWATRIRQALANNNFQLYCQPIVAVSPKNGASVPSYEILLRAFDENDKLSLPHKFLGPAEHYGLMPDIDAWVIESTFAWLLRQTSQNHNVGYFSINISGQSLSKREFLDTVISLLHEYPVDPEKVCFEITETSAIANIQNATKLIRVLKGMGCHFALDDFGSGMSSFAYLKQLPIDYLKIDGSYVRDIVNDPVDRSMVEAVHQIGHAMGLKTIAEFVEDEGILDALKHIGVDYAQGFYIARPEPLENLFENQSVQNIL